MDLACSKTISMLGADNKHHAPSISINILLSRRNAMKFSYQYRIMTATLMLVKVPRRTCLPLEHSSHRFPTVKSKWKEQRVVFWCKSRDARICILFSFSPASKREQPWLISLKQRRLHTTGQSKRLRQSLGLEDLPS